MCMSVVIHRRDKPEVECETIKQLYGYAPFLVGISPICPVEYGNCCLCPLDLEETANQNGYKMTQTKPDGEFDPFAYHWYPKGV